MTQFNRRACDCLRYTPSDSQTVAADTLYTRSPVTPFSLASDGHLSFHQVEDIQCRPLTSNCNKIAVRIVHRQIAVHAAH